METACLCIEKVNNVVVATPSVTELDESDATDLVDEMIGCIRYDGSQYFVLDLSRVEWVSSAALGALLILYQELEHVRGHMVLANCQANVESLFETTRLDTMISIHDDLDDAIEKVTR